ncbi:DUF2130 domain-containing protein [Chryseobacterium sp.]|uniref:DUF2130 domain-containing protein n=1 Tax=Chryseobacterium sp. TaxID=1871047 RepID=UPI00289EE9F1|nr:DUF2130 domain-containing protein [Chryseobacterium sp.]
MNTENKASHVCCPHCSKEIDIDHILYQKVELKAQKEYEAKYKELEELKSKAHEEILKYESEVNNKYEKLFEDKQAEIKKKLEEQNSESFANMQKELDDQNEKLKEYNALKIEIHKLERKNANLRSEIELELNEDLNNEREKIAKKEYEKFELKLSESQKTIDDLNKQLSDAQRKAEQGSSKLKGEVQELGIEDWLKSNFPLDIINDVKNGKRGADCIQVINTRTFQGCGTIYYESKRTKEFQSSWIEKFKDDMREKGANIGVLVTNTLPRGIERMSQIDGIWICTYTEFKALCFVLRQHIIHVSKLVNAQENKGEKMSNLYNYLIGEEFRNNIEAIIEGFTQMQKDMDDEKVAYQAMWKKREKQIQKVLVNTSDLYGSIQGIAGNVIKPIEKLELPKKQLTEIS